ncbi:MAG: fibrobacter succinogenes major paralogous domain-containing protein [Muribaculaceae bacterium]|nr:fibrobacter succinogenes major paralogous domain-containing protein [Muribaculaceae bacterium]
MMKKFFTLIALAVLSIAALAQSTPNRLIVTMKNGDVTVYNIADVDSLSFDLIEGDVVATPEFKDFEWDGDNGNVTVGITLSDAAQSYRLAILDADQAADPMTALAGAALLENGGDIYCTLTGAVAGQTYTIATIAYDKYGMAGDVVTTTFVVPEKTVSMPALSIAIPTSFNDCWVQRVMFGGVKVAEVCKEYIKEFDDQRVVVYPCDENGYAILTKGVSASDGGTVVWDEATNTVAYTAGNSTALSVVYLVDGEIVLTAPETAEAAIVEAELLVDKRGSEEQVYQIVKIGTQYWLAENLRTAKWVDGTDIPMYKSTQSAEWSANTTGACHVYADDNDYISIFGLLYNGYCIANADMLAPEGWEVPSQDQWAALRTYGGPTANNFKSDTDYSWNMGKEGTNVTGFNVWAAGLYSPATGDADDGADAWYWSTTPYEDPLSSSPSFQMIRFNQTSKNMVRYTTSGHIYTFGHSVRCIRKK